LSAVVSLASLSLSLSPELDSFIYSFKQKKNAKAKRRRRFCDFFWMILSGEGVEIPSTGW